MNYEQLREQFKHNITFYCYDHTLTPDRDETIDYYCKQYEMEIFELKKQLDKTNAELTTVKASTPELEPTRVKFLEKRHAILTALEIEGVDNWEWYGEALNGLENIENEK